MGKTGNPIVYVYDKLINIFCINYYPETTPNVSHK